MCRAQCVLALVALYVGLAHSWDLAVSSGDQLIFYLNNGVETNRIQFKSRNLGGLAFDTVNNMMLYVDKQNNNDTICGYDLSSEKNECFIERSGRNILSIAYDPVTEKLFFTDANEKSINWISLKRASTNNIYGNLLIKMDDRTPDDITVDSCGGYIYWSKSESMENIDLEKARFDGSGREALYDEYIGLDVISLTFDPQTQNIIFIHFASILNGSLMLRADTNGRKINSYFYKGQSVANELTAAKDNFYFVTTTTGDNFKSVRRFPKDTSCDFKWITEGTNCETEISKFYTEGSLGIVANYKIEDQINGIQNCNSLSNLIPTITDVSGSTCERCDVCVNYCLHGNCSVNDEGLPKCSCNVGYSGERCEVSACHRYCENDGECSLYEDGVPFCQCKENFSGDRCQNECLNYCFHGNCSLTYQGYLDCSCDPGYSGERCEVSECYGYCLNDGECSLDEDDYPVCKCAGNHEGARCEANVTATTPAHH